MAKQFDFRVSKANNGLILLVNPGSSGNNNAYVATSMQDLQEHVIAAMVKAEMNVDDLDELLNDLEEEANAVPTPPTHKANTPKRPYV